MEDSGQERTLVMSKPSETGNITHANKYVVREHRGRSGKSVFAWRVYRIYENGSEIQLAKYRSRDAAEAARGHYILNNERIRARIAARVGV